MGIGTHACITHKHTCNTHIYKNKSLRKRTITRKGLGKALDLKFPRGTSDTYASLPSASAHTPLPSVQGFLPGFRVTVWSEHTSPAILCVIAMPHE